MTEGSDSIFDGFDDGRFKYARPQGAAGHLKQLLDATADVPQESLQQTKKRLSRSQEDLKNATKAFDNDLKFLIKNGSSEKLISERLRKGTYELERMENELAHQYKQFLSGQEQIGETKTLSQIKQEIKASRLAKVDIELLESSPNITDVTDDQAYFKKDPVQQDYSRRRSAFNRDESKQLGSFANRSVSSGGFKNQDSRLVGAEDVNRSRTLINQFATGRKKLPRFFPNLTEVESKQLAKYFAVFQNSAFYWDDRSI